MSDTGSLHSITARDTTAREAVVRPLARAAQRACVRPGCPSPARATLSFRYDSREAWLERLADEPRPEAYDLCAPHAARTQPPHGWQLRDRRPREEQAEGEPPTAPAELGGEQTVALLAAALRSVPDPGFTDGPAAQPADAPMADVGGPMADVDGPTADVGGPTADGPTADAESFEDASSPVLEPLRDPPAPPDDPLPTAPPTRSALDEPRRNQPRPVLAARERGVPMERDRAADGPARDW